MAYLPIHCHFTTGNIRMNELCTRKSRLLVYTRIPFKLASDL